MARYLAKKIGGTLAMGALLCVAVGLWSREGRVYAGFLAAFLGAAFLLTAWLRVLKAKGTDLFGRLRRKENTGVPYFHRGDKEKRAGLRPGRDRRGPQDSIAFEQEENAPELQLRMRWDAIAYSACGVAFLLVSLMI